MFLQNFLLEALGSTVGQQGTLRALKIRSEETKLSLFVDAMATYVESWRIHRQYVGESDSPAGFCGYLVDVQREWGGRHWQSSEHC